MACRGGQRGGGLEPGAPLARIHIHDVTPTLLYGLGLPVAENFAGESRVELFTAAFRASHPVRTIPAWGLPRDGFVTTSEEDEAIRERLGALGYLE